MVESALTTPRFSLPGRITRLEKTIADASSFQYHVKIDFEPQKCPDEYTLDLLIHQPKLDDLTEVGRIVPPEEITQGYDVLDSSLPLIVLLVETKRDPEDRRLKRFWDYYLFSRQGTPLSHGWQHYVVGKGQYNPLAYKYDHRPDIKKLRAFGQPIAGMIEGYTQTVGDTSEYELPPAIATHPATIALRTNSLLEPPRQSPESNAPMWYI